MSYLISKKSNPTVHSILDTENKPELFKNAFISPLSKKEGSHFKDVIVINCESAAQELGRKLANRLYKQLREHEEQIIDTYNQQHNASKDYIEINIHS